ncbi:helix-turn-helix domain-containing protein [Caldibacillus lycopersici]|uniref:Helix-turn-helix domain-containing protein n=1 Tax=Perspicuibacillus lycopersici TaxID=1325689 RepID=A0AAE3LNR8_9BACI|nr:helix-turn-helix transcriptional regulator [Perspicuibacillus lycopersici]MCU9614127.1 helix-turn-helix domain-containing protein [Perspicuibacillus lycopersici]
MSILSERLRMLRKRNKLTQKNVADYLGMTESGYGYYEQGRNQPSVENLKKLAEKFGVTVSYLTGDDEEKQISVGGKEIKLTEDEYKVFEELKKHKVIFHDLASDPEKKVKELITLYKMKKILLEDDDEEDPEGFGEFED